MKLHNFVFSFGGFSFVKVFVTGALLWGALSLSNAQAQHGHHGHHGYYGHHGGYPYPNFYFGYYPARPVYVPPPATVYYPPSAVPMYYPPAPAYVTPPPYYPAPGPAVGVATPGFSFFYGS